MINWRQSPDVESHPDVVSGAFVVRGTRVPAQAIVDNAEDGFSAEQIVSQIYPSLPLEVTRRVIAFAKLVDAHSPG